MREIKFRGFDKIADTWVSGQAVKDKDIKERWYIFINEDERVIIDNTETIGQYTGLKDKDGFKIFEGDILSDKVQTEEGLIKSYKQVYFHPTGMWVLDNSYKQDKSTNEVLFQELQDYDYKVAGNIHENKELLER